MGIRVLSLPRGLLDVETDCHVGPAGLLAMTMVFCHSEERSDVGIRPFYDERGFGPMYLGHGLRRPNSVPKFGALVIGIGPYGDGGRHAGSSCPTGGCGEPPRSPWVAAHSGASAARMGGMG